MFKRTCEVTACVHALVTFDTLHTLWTHIILAIDIVVQCQWIIVAHADKLHLPLVQYSVQVCRPCFHSIPSPPHILDRFAAVDWKVILPAAVMISKLERCCTAIIVKWCKSWGDKLKTSLPSSSLVFYVAYDVGVKILVTSYCILHQQKGWDRGRWVTHRVLWTWPWL